MLAHEKQILEYEKAIARLKEQDKSGFLWSEEELNQLEIKLEELKKRVYSELTPWERVNICRHPKRPHAVDYIKNLCEHFAELSGDRLFKDDHAVITGLAKIAGQKFMIVAQEKGHDTASRIHRNFGMPHPEGYRKALRCMQLAEKFHLPILSIIDTAGAYAGLSAEERGQGRAIAHNLFEMAQLATPIIVLLIGEGASGGALGTGMGDVVAMLQHAYYSVITPEGCASILWKDTAKKEIAAEALKMHAEDLLQLGVIDTIIEEPPGGAHHDPQFVYHSVEEFVLNQWNILKQIPTEVLLEKRYQKFRSMGKFALEENFSLR